MIDPRPFINYKMKTYALKSITNYQETQVEQGILSTIPSNLILKYSARNVELVRIMTATLKYSQQSMIIVKKDQINITLFTAPLND